MLELDFENPWIRAAVIMGLSVLLTLIARGIFRFVLIPLVGQTQTEIDDIILKAVKKILSYAIPIVGLMLALTPFSLETPIPTRILFSVLVLLLMRTFLVALGDVSNWLQKIWVDKTESTLDDGLLPIARKAGKTLVVIMGVLIILGKWEIEIGPMLGALGIGGLAIGLALNTSLANIFGGIQLILDSSIRVGDKIMLESGEVAVILDIGLRSTKLRTYDNEVISVPNSQLSNARIKNFTKPDSQIRVTVNFGVAYGSSISQTKEVILKVISKIEDILDDPPPQVLFLNMGDYSLDMCARVWVQEYGNQFAKKLEMTELVYNTLNENGLEIPFPTRTVYVKKDS